MIATWMLFSVFTVGRLGHGGVTENVYLARLKLGGRSPLLITFVIYLFFGCVFWRALKCQDAGMGVRDSLLGS